MKPLLPFAAALLIAAAPAADPEQLYRDGVAARHAGDQARAISLLRQVVEAQPANADALLQLGLALSAARRDEEAEQRLREALALAPDYDDVRIALARLEERQGNKDAALQVLAPVAETNSEAADLRARLGLSRASAAYRWRADLDGSYSTLGGGRPDWRESALSLRYQADRWAAGASVELSRRFGVTDAYGELRLERRFSDAVSAYATLGATPNADFRPEWQIGAGGSARLRGGPAATVATLDARQARYRAGDIQTLTPGLEQYLADGRVWLTARWINVFDETGTHHSGWLVRGDVQPRDDLRLFAGVADAPDVSEGVVIDARTLFGGVSADVSARTTLRASLAHEDRETGADRTQIGVGLGLRF